MHRESSRPELVAQQTVTQKGGNPGSFRVPRKETVRLFLGRPVFLRFEQVHRRVLGEVEHGGRRVGGELFDVP